VIVRDVGLLREIARVVEEHHHHRQPVLLRGAERGHDRVVVERAVADRADHRAIAVRVLDAEREPEAEPETAVTRLVEVQDFMPLDRKRRPTRT
jgi:hypothetical protein